MYPITAADYKKQRGKLDWLTAYAQPLPARGRRLTTYKHLQVDGVVQAGAGRGKILGYDLIGTPPFSERFLELQRATDERLTAVETVKVRTEAELLIFQQKCLLAGHEGCLLHFGRGGYMDGGLAEVRQWTEDLFKVVDDKPGKGRHVGESLVTCQTTRGHYFDVYSTQARPAKRTAKLKLRYAYLAKTGEPVPYLPVAMGWVN